MQISYLVIGKTDDQAFSDYLTREGVLPLPLLGLIQEAKLAVGEIIAPSGCAMIEAPLRMDAQRAPGDRHAGKPGGVICRHGPRPGVFDGAGPGVLYHNPAKSLRRAKILFVIRTSFYPADRCPRPARRGGSGSARIGAAYFGCRRSLVATATRAGTSSPDAGEGWPAASPNGTPPDERPTRVIGGRWFMVFCIAVYFRPIAPWVRLDYKACSP